MAAWSTCLEATETIDNCFSVNQIAQMLFTSDLEDARAGIADLMPPTDVLWLLCELPLKTCNSHLREKKDEES